MPSYGWVFDPKRCIECRACEAACKQWNKVETGVGIRYRLVRTYELSAWPKPQTMALSGACNHCENAWCMKACPVKAIHRKASDGTVQIDRDKCVGCTQCTMFCPYQAPQFDVRVRKAEKCTMCTDRIEVGLQPACATMCPTGALQWGKWEDVQGKGVAQVSNFANPKNTVPHMRFITDGFGAK